MSFDIQNLDYYVGVAETLDTTGSRCSSTVMDATNTMYEWWGQPDKRILMHQIFRYTEKDSKMRWWWTIYQVIKILSQRYQDAVFYPMEMNLHLCLYQTIFQSFLHLIKFSFSNSFSFSFHAIICSWAFNSLIQNVLFSKVMW